MFSVITNIYDRKTIGPTLIDLFAAEEKLKKFPFDNKRFSMCAPRVTLTHRYDIQVLAKHVSIWVHKYSSLMQ
jgi:hypothetical protein